MQTIKITHFTKESKIYMSKKKELFGKRILTTALALAMLFTSNISVNAQETSVTSVTESCQECGTPSFYQTIGYGEWEYRKTTSCSHGTCTYDRHYERAVYNDTRCMYCNNLINRQFIKYESKTECSYDY